MMSIVQQLSNLSLPSRPSLKMIKWNKDERQRRPISVVPNEMRVYHVVVNGETPQQDTHPVIWGLSGIFPRTKKRNDGTQYFHFLSQISLVVEKAPACSFLAAHSLSSFCQDAELLEKTAAQSPENAPCGLLGEILIIEDKPVENFLFSSSQSVMKNTLWHLKYVFQLCHDSVSDKLLIFTWSVFSVFRVWQLFTKHVHHLHGQLNIKR